MAKNSAEYWIPGLVAGLILLIMLATDFFMDFRVDWFYYTIIPLLLVGVLIPVFLWLYRKFIKPKLKNKNEELLLKRF